MSVGHGSPICGTPIELNGIVTGTGSAPEDEVEVGGARIVEGPLGRVD